MPPSPPPPSLSPPLLELREVGVAGRGSPRLEAVNLVVRPGERVALLGASGAGKSTLLAVAGGVLAPSSGQVVWQGQPPDRRRRHRRRQQARLGTLWQDLRLIEELTVQQNLNAGRLAEWGWLKAVLNLLLPLETAANAAVLARLDLPPSLLDQPVGALSGGQRQRVAIARLLRQNPTLLLADEPLASLDPRLAQALLALLQEQAAAPRALVLSLHRPDLLAGFDRVVGLRQGRLLFDRPAAALTSGEGPALLRQLYAGEPPGAAGAPAAPAEGSRLPFIGGGHG